MLPLCKAEVFVSIRMSPDESTTELPVDTVNAPDCAELPVVAMLMCPLYVVSDEPDVINTSPPVPSPLPEPALRTIIPPTCVDAPTCMFTSPPAEVVDVATFNRNSPLSANKLSLEYIETDPEIP